MEYPYYIATYRKELFAAPPGLESIYKSFNTRPTEKSNSDFHQLMVELREEGVNARYDAELYVVQSMGQQRRKLQSNEIMHLLHPD